jgi:uncharacterized membrane protein YraQ (UPF0718 family)
VNRPIIAAGPEDDASPAGTRAAVAGTALVLVAAVVGLSWAKWWPYTERTRGLLATHAWPGSNLLRTGADDGSAWERGWHFTLAYGAAVWKALLVALVVAALLDALVPRRWVVRTLSRTSPSRSSLTAGLLSLPGMMCTCCTAPLTVTMRRAGVPRGAAIAFWWGNPVLNPAVLGFLLVLAPWQWFAVRAAAGVLLVVGVAALVGSLADARAARRVDPALVPGATDADPAEATSPAALPGRTLRSLLRLAVVLVPEYLLVVFAVGALGPRLTSALSPDHPGGLLVVVLVAFVGAVLVLPTGGEIPVLLGLAAAGASAGVLGALLVVLPTVSLPSAVMVGRALGWGTTAVATLSVVLTGLLAGGLLTVLS